MYPRDVPSRFTHTHPPSESERLNPLNRERGNKVWINPLLAQLKLVRKSAEGSAPGTPWEQIERCTLPDRVGRIAAEINEAAGYHLLETLYYLPPQKVVLSVRFYRNRDKYSMHIEVRDNKVLLKFAALKRLFPWDRYFSSDSRNANIVWQQTIQPGDVLDEHIQGWMAYLLSSYSKEFRPDQAPSSSAPESDLGSIVRKASA